MHSVLSSFFTGPISGEEKKRRLEQKLQRMFTLFDFYCANHYLLLVLAECISKNDPTRYLLTLEQMIENDYPIPSYMADVFEKPPDWAEVPEPKATEYKLGRPKVYAIDCEMVLVHSPKWVIRIGLMCSLLTKCVTENGKELTRVCVIDFDSGIVVFDQLVKPSKPILDYLTRFGPTFFIAPSLFSNIKNFV